MATKASSVSTRTVLDSGGKFCELRIGKVRHQLTPAEASRSRHELEHWLAVETREPLTFDDWVVKDGQGGIACIRIREGIPQPLNAVFGAEVIAALYSARAVPVQIKDTNNLGELFLIPRKENKKEPDTCAECGKEFIFPTVVVTHVFCSVECAHAYAARPRT